RNRLNKKNEFFSNEDDRESEEFNFYFTIGSSVVGNVFIDFKLEQACNGHQGNGCFAFRLYDSNNTQIPSGMAGDIYLEPGTYRIYAYTGTVPEGEETKYFDVSVKWEEDPFPDTIHVGGLRVKEIIKNDGFKDVLKKTYN